MAVRKGYKLTEVGELPEDWDICKVKDLCSITTGSKNTEDNVPDGKYPFFVRSQKVERINSYSFDGEGVLTAGDGVGTGKIFHYINGKCDIHQRVYLMYDFNDSILPYYFFYYFKYYFYDRIMKMTAKSSVDSVRKDMIAEMRVAVPSISQQMIITSSLSGIDALISSLEQLISKKRLIKQGVMQELLSGKKRLLGFKGEWKLKKLGKISNIQIGRTPSRSNDNFWGVGYPWLSIADLNRKYITTSKEQITKAATEQLTLIRKGTLLMSFKLTIGRCAFAGCDLYTNEAICAFTDLTEDKHYLYYALTQMDLNKYGKQAVKGVTLNQDLLHDIEINFPELNEQAAIASILSDMDDEIAALEAKLAKTQQIRTGMMEELLTGRIRLV